MAVHIELDAIREMIVAGRADPQRPSGLQSEQYVLSVAACCALGRVFYDAGYDVAIDDVLPPDAFHAHWKPLLADFEWRVVIVLPNLAATLARSARRTKRVLEIHTRAQHAASAGWPDGVRIDTTGLTVEQSLPLVEAVIAYGQASGS